MIESGFVVMGVALPRCVTCRTSIRPGQNVVFRQDGRVEHVACPDVVCAVCNRAIKRDEPIRRDGDALLHAYCWWRRSGRE